MSEIQAEHPITLARSVRFGDCDPAGIVFTPNYSRFVFDACEVWLRRVIKVDIADQLRDDEVGTPVRAISVQLLYPLKPADDFTMRVWVKEIGRASFTLLVIGENGRGRRCFVGEMTCVSTIRLKREVIDLPDHYRRAMEDYRAKSGEPEIEAA